VFVGSTGADQTMRADTTTGPLSYNPSTCALSLGATSASITVGATTGVVTVGTTMGTINVGTGATGIINLGGAGMGFINNPNGNINIVPNNILRIRGNTEVLSGTFDCLQGLITGASIASTNTISADGTITGAGLISSNNITATSGTITGLTLSASGGISSGGIVAAGTITGNAFIGDGSALTGIDNMNVVNTNDNATYYPTFVSGVGANQVMRADTITGPLSYNPNTCGLSLGAASASITVGATTGVVTVGTAMGTINVGTGATGVINLGSTAGGYIMNTNGDITVAPKTALNVTGTVSGVTFNASGGIGSAGTIYGAGLYSAGTMTCDGTIYGANVDVSGNITSEETITGATLSSNGGIFAAGTITGNAFIGDGSALTGIDNMNIVDTNENAAYYPVFVGSTGAGQTMRADTITGPLSYNPRTCALSLGATSASMTVGATTGVVTVGTAMGTINVGTGATGVVNLGSTAGGYINNANGSITIDPSNVLYLRSNVETFGNFDCASGTITGAGLISSNNITAASGTITGLTLSASGGISSGDISSTGAIIGATFIGNGSRLTNIDNMTIVNTNDDVTYYPTFVSGMGANQVMRADTSNRPLTYNPSTGALSFNADTASLTIGGSVGVINLGGVNGGNINNSTGGIFIDGDLIVKGNISNIRDDAVIQFDNRTTSPLSKSITGFNNGNAFNYYQLTHQTRTVFLDNPSTVTGNLSGQLCVRLPSPISTFITDGSINRVNQGDVIRIYKNYATVNGGIHIIIPPDIFYHSTFVSMAHATSDGSDDAVISTTSLPWKVIEIVYSLFDRGSSSSTTIGGVTIVFPRYYPRVTIIQVA
jgi:hypothetical protein